MYLAASNNHIDVIKYLCELDASITHGLLGACNYERLSLIEFFLEKGAGINSVDGRNPLFFASGHANLPAVKFLVSLGQM